MIGFHRRQFFPYNIIIALRISSFYMFFHMFGLQFHHVKYFCVMAYYIFMNLNCYLNGNLMKILMIAPLSFHLEKLCGVVLWVSCFMKRCCFLLLRKRIDLNWKRMADPISQEVRHSLWENLSLIWEFNSQVIIFVLKNQHIFLIQVIDLLSQQH